MVAEMDAHPNLVNTVSPPQTDSIPRVQEQHHEKQDRRASHVILNDCKAIGAAIDDLELRLNTLRRHQSTALFGGRNTDFEGYSKQVLTDCRGLADRIKRIQALPDSQEYKNKFQVELLSRRIQKAIRVYQQSESNFRKDIQEALRRQLFIVRPYATEKEIQEVIDNSDYQIFEQALINADRRGQAQATLFNSRQRRNELEQIEKTMIELRQIFNDLDTIIEQQQKPMVQMLEQKTIDAHEALERGNVQIDRAITSARAARKKKWICLGMCFAIILVSLISMVVWAKVTGRFVSL